MLTQDCEHGSAATHAPECNVVPERVRKNKPSVFVEDPEARDPATRVILSAHLASL